MKNQSTELMELPPQNKVKTLLRRIGKRNVVIACAVLLIGAAVWLNWLLFSAADNTDGYPNYDQPSGNISDNANNQQSGSTGGDVSVSDTYFSATLVNRQKARDEALEVLQAVVDNADSTEAVKNEALAEISTIAQEIQLEANMESLITAKGFEQCVAVMNGDTVSIIVSADSLQPAQIAQINAIVYEQTGIAPSGVTIMHK